MRPLRRAEGQAVVELVAVVPFVLVVAVALVQLLAAGYAAVLAGNAAQAGALALAGRADPEASARRALPPWGHRRARVRAEAGRVTVRLRPPTLLGPLGRALEVTASSAVAR